jgi:hypothetical protein
MSRTYRIRHLPKLKANKFVDAGMYRRTRPWDEALSAIAKSYSSIDRWGVIDSLQHDFPFPVAPKTAHPWVGWGRIKRIKTWYKRNGNRLVRRHNRLLLTKGQEVLESAHFFTKKDGWDVWNIT